ncbi:MAG: hypothetical protein DRO96_00860 [Candidatus Aenigmatarchaeota archaeon]|nr:MAG: hypothetical protein B6U68_00475 [Candidatus Aenigmarchaeota archaeon ex4484_14]RLB76953.1 MAG: hypothetical protein DRH15_11935 [Deltaproteobacteria bacterium]RLI97380.1 MAG: hypothetical protein DRO96_00860 [Candidatus Aenigmarchaeota archaeon]
MKGQYRIVSEVLLFGIGIGIAILVLTTYQTLSNSISKITFSDQLEGVSEIITSNIVKVFENKNVCWIVLEIPNKVSGREYKIVLDNKNYATAYLVISDYENPKIRVEKELFNISNNNIDYSEVLSTARYINISRDVNEKISISRCEFYE